MPNAPRFTSRTRLLVAFVAALLTTSLLLQQMYSPRRVRAAGFTAGNLVVYRVGTGGAALAATATAVFLDEYTPSGTFVQSIALPTTVNGSNRRLTATGNSTTEGLMTRSVDGRYLIAAGYDAALGTTVPGAAGTLNRVVGRVDSSGTIDTTTALNDPSANVRGAASTNGTDLWISCSSNGSRYATLGTVGSSTQLSTTVTNLRATTIFNNQLYVSSASGAFQGVATVGSGTPTTSGQTITLLPGFPTVTGPSSLAFVFFNSTTLYVADDRAIASGGGLQRWTFSGGTWSLSKTFTTGLTAGLRGVTLSVNSSGQAVLWATTADTKLVTVTDTNSASDSFSTIATAATNTAFRGVAFAPIPSSTNPSGVGAANPSSVAPGGSTLLTVTVTPGTNPASTGLGVTANLTSIGGSSTQAFHDDGLNGDATAGDNIFSFSATVDSGTTPGGKTLPFTVSDAQLRSSTGNVSLTVTSPTPTNPTGTGLATPNSVLPGEVSKLTVNVTPGTNPTSTGIVVTADLSPIGGSSSQQLFDDGSNGDATMNDNVFTYDVTVSIGTTPGPKSLPFSISDAQSRTGSGSISLTVQSPPPPANHVVISQLYGGGGNSGAPYTNDYIELYNPTGVSFTLTGWSLQYASAAGTTWTNKQPLGGTIAPGEYYLVSLGSGGANGSPLPASNISGDINMSATTGKVALVNNSVSLSGGCPLGTDPDIVDFVGYGTSATCHEGAANAPTPSNTNAIFRKNNGATDTDQNGTDFIAAAANPRRTSPIVELGPWVAGTDPITNGTTVPYDATITVDFSEPVDVIGAWYDITCTNSGQHNSATVASYNGSKGYHVTPNVSFQFSEQCTVTINKDQVHDQDLDDSAPNTDTLFENYTWSFTVVDPGTAAPYPPSVHLTMGNPSNAVADLLQPNNYLMEKPTYTLSYNRDKGTPNWVSWHLETAWFGGLARVDTFRPDPKVSPDWYRVQATDYFSSGFDRGHMTPNADRNNLNRIPINQETYLMTNMIPQSPDNNQGPWASFENYLRSILPGTPENEIYIVSGPQGVGGTGSNGGTTTTLAGGHVTVPAYTWKVALVIPKDTGDDVSRVTCGSRTIAILMPNTQDIRTNPWENYLTTVDAIEALTGYDFFSNLPDAVENCVEAGTNGTNPPGTANQSASTAEDTAVQITLDGVRSNNNTLTYSIVSGPTHGTLGSIGTPSCSGGACTATLTYNPGSNYHGPDSFTFKVNDGIRDSNVSTVSITVTDVNDPPDAVDDAATINEDSGANTIDVLANDTDVDVGDTLSVSAVTQGAHGSVVNNVSSVSYTPAANYFGPDSFTYTVTDGHGGFDTATVNITVNNVPECVTPTNVALGSSGATAVASSEYSANFPASGAIDGEHNGNNWGAGGGWNDQTRGVFPDNVQVNFNVTQTIGEIDVDTLKNQPNNGSLVNDSTPATSYGIKNFDVQYWDGSTWVTVTGGAVTGNTFAKRKFIFVEVMTDKIRVVVNDSADHLFSRVVEIEAFSCTPVVVPPPPTPTPTPCGTNIALATNGSTAVATSQYSANFPTSGAIDGEHNGNNWGAAGAGGWNDQTRGVFPDNIQINFNTNQTINDIDVYTLKNTPNNGSTVNDTTPATSYGIKNFNVQYWDGTGFVDVPGGVVTGNTLAKRRFIFFTPITTDKIRVVVNDSADHLFSRVVEIEAFSCGP